MEVTVSFPEVKHELSIAFGNRRRGEDGEKEKFQKKTFQQEKNLLSYFAGKESS